jgi:acyl-CoA reductase-like NAD-dependent aldehyde dehydrogenase
VVSEADTIEVQPRPCWIAGRAEQGERTLTVRHPYDGTEVVDVAVPGAEQIERAVAAAHDVARAFAATPAHERAEALRLAADLIADRAEEIAETITAENGKPLKWANVEVDNAVATFRLAAEETGRLAGDLERPAGQGLAVVRRRPRGPVLVVTPFNYPLGLVADKVAPALAVGAPVVVRPASATPMTALLLGEILSETNLPAGAFSILPSDRQIAGTPVALPRVGSTAADSPPAGDTAAGSDPAAGASAAAAPDDLVTDPRLPVITFTGTAAEGWAIAAAAQRKHVVLELDGNSAAVVCEDWASDTDLDTAAARIAVAANGQAGQSRFAVRQVLVHADVADRLIPRLVDAVRDLPTGDPHAPDVEVGPLIDEAAADRITEWLTATVGTVLTGGTRTGTTVTPTVIRDDAPVPGPDPAPALGGTHAFGPVLVVSAVDSLAAAFDRTPATAYGVFTHHVGTAFEAAAGLDAARVVIGDVPSGTGADGVRATMEAFTRAQVTVLTDGRA